ncbi:hypothetical protein BDB01DRAFT_775478 [Pilobolus umbonatus]|nr:hypothetical protein BDB01DRAFT_775478 [Pilobolus umbonatus]
MSTKQIAARKMTNTSIRLGAPPTSPTFVEKPPSPVSPVSPHTSPKTTHYSMGHKNIKLSKSTATSFIAGYKPKEKEQTMRRQSEGHNNILSPTKSLPTNHPNEHINERTISPTRRTGITSPVHRIDFSKIKSKIGSLDNVKHKPGGGAVKIFDENAEKLKERITAKVEPKVGSRVNIKHKPGGGDVQIYDDKGEFIKSKPVTAKIGSLDNIKHKPGGGDVQIYDDKGEFIKSKPVTAKIGSLDNIKHKPGGGDLVIYDDKGEFIKSKPISAKIGSLDNIKHKPGGGDLVIYDDKGEFIKSKPVTAKIGSLENIKHKPGGGDLMIYNEKLRFRDIASPRIDAGTKRSPLCSPTIRSPLSPRSPILQSPTSVSSMEEENDKISI